MTIFIGSGVEKEQWKGIGMFDVWSRPSSFPSPELKSHRDRMNSDTHISASRHFGVTGDCNSLEILNHIISFFNLLPEEEQSVSKVIVLLRHDDVDQIDCMRQHTRNSSS